MLICPVLLAFCPLGFAQESPGGGSAKPDTPKVIETEDMKLAMKAAAGKYDEALKLYEQATTIAACYTFTEQRFDNARQKLTAQSSCFALLTDAL